MTLNLVYHSDRKISSWFRTLLFYLETDSFVQGMIVDQRCNKLITYVKDGAGISGKMLIKINWIYTKFSW